MQMPSVARMRDLDSRSWSTATWTIPFTTQLVLGVAGIIFWSLGKATYFNDSHERCWFLTAAIATALVSLPTGFACLASRSSRIRGVAVSIMGASVVVFSGIVIYAFWILR